MSSKEASDKVDKSSEKAEDESKASGRFSFSVSPELISQVKDFFLGTFGLGLVAGGLFGGAVFFLLFNIVGFYCTPNNYLLAEKANILFFSVKLLVGIALVLGFVFSIVFRNVSSGKFKKILLAVLAVEFVFAGAFILAFETPHCKNFQTLISSSPVAKGEVTVIDERQVTADEAWDTYPVWSPDGSKLAFIRERPMVFDAADIWVISKEGGNLRQLLSEQMIEMEYPSWSPGGKLLAYSVFTEGSREVWLYDVLGGSRKQLTSSNVLGHISPSFSPDGTEILYLGVGSKDQDIWLMESSGENQRQVTTGSENDKTPSWSPDGSRIVFVRVDENGAGDIWIINKDGAGLKQLTSGASSESNPRFSPDGRRIAFLSRAPQQSGKSIIADEKASGVFDTLWVMDSDGSGVKQLSLDRVDNEYSWSPRGDMIVFVKLAENAASMWVVPVIGGGSEKQLTLSQPFPTFPAWSPDGSRIVFSVFNPGRRNLWEALLTQ